MNITKEQFMNWCKKPKSVCWIWQGPLNADGYGFYSYGGSNYNAHRAAYELWRGSIPDGLTIDHLCRVRSCVNPNHLECVTNEENVRRGKSYKFRSHCIKGHVLSGENAIPVERGEKTTYRCRTCRCESQNRYRNNNRERMREHWRSYAQRKRDAKLASKAEGKR
jgi:hypothetical protein